MRLLSFKLYTVNKSLFIIIDGSFLCYILKVFIGLQDESEFLAHESNINKLIGLGFFYKSQKLRNENIKIFQF